MSGTLRPCIGVASNAAADCRRSRSAAAAAWPRRRCSLRGLPLRPARGCITTVAGGGSYLGDGAPAPAAIVYVPGVLAVDTAGNLYVATSGRIRRVDALTGIIHTVAGNYPEVCSGSDGPALAACIPTVTGLAVDAAGNVYFSDFWGSRVRKIDVLNGIVTILVGTGNYGASGDGGPAAAAELGRPEGLAVDSSGNLLIADRAMSRVRKVDLRSGIITTFAGTGAWGFAGDNGPAAGATLNGPSQIAVDSVGKRLLL